MHTFSNSPSLDSIAGQKNQPECAGPAWDNSAEYASLESPSLKAELDDALRLLIEIEALGATLSGELENAHALEGACAQDVALQARRMSSVRWKALIALSNVSTYVNCELSTDGRNAAARSLFSQLQSLQARLAEAVQPLTQFLRVASAEAKNHYLDSPETYSETYLVNHDRKLKETTLPLAHENLLTALGVDGHNAWGNLYTNISGSLVCHVNRGTGDTEKMGIAKTAGLLQHADRAVRKCAWKAINTAWESQEEACAAVLNALAGWRLETYKRRSSMRPVHFLDSPLHANRMRKETLDAMLGAVAAQKNMARKAMNLRAKALGQTQLAPWDLFAPAPQLGGQAQAPIPFEHAIEMVRMAFERIHPDMGEFVRLMESRRWIEGTIGDRKRPGAYCTSFAKSRTPRVYMTYAGSMTNVGTLAHELGHAFHTWVMRDLPMAESSYPMNLAETASIFAEAALADAQASSATSPQLAFDVGWEDADSASAFLLNIPARFTFESRLYEERAHKTLTPDELKVMMSDAWGQWYGESLSEMDPMFWASKLHFHMSQRSFYNFPYTFGYLFSLGVYAQQSTLGESFYPKYVALLRDTGRMDAEDLVAKHLGADITQQGFWNDSLRIVSQKIDRFETAITKLSAK